MPEKRADWNYWVGRAMGALHLASYNNPRDMPPGMANLQAELGLRHRRWESARKKRIDAAGE